MQWVQRILRGNRVYVRVDENGEPAADTSGRVDVVYKLAPGAKVYRANVKNLASTGDPADDQPVDANITDDAAETPPGDAILIYTDGACHGNPGPMGVGVVIMDGKKREEISDFIGHGTNNIAELTAIERALAAVPKGQRARPIRLHSDSSYSIGLLQKGWKAKANQELVARIRKLQTEFPNLLYVKVKGHAGVPENERCDELANEAIHSQT